MPEACAKRFLPSDNAAREEPPPLPYVPCLFTPATALHVGCHFLHKRTQFSMLRAAREEEREREGRTVRRVGHGRMEGEQGGGACLR